MVNPQKIKCPKCGGAGKIITTQKQVGCNRCFGRGELVVYPGIKCPQCGSSKVWRDGKRVMPDGKIQRYLCRECSYKFSQR